MDTEYKELAEEVITALESARNEHKAALNNYQNVVRRFHQSEADHDDMRKAFNQEREAWHKLKTTRDRYFEL